MEILDFFKEKLNIDVLIVLIVLGAGFFQKKYLSIPWSKDPSHDASLKTLVISFVASTIYIILFHLQNATLPIEWVKYFISYFFATSFYELLLRPFIKWWGTKFGDKDVQP